MFKDPSPPEQKTISSIKVEEVVLRQNGQKKKLKRSPYKNREMVHVFQSEPGTEFSSIKIGKWFSAIHGSSRMDRFCSIRIEAVVHVFKSNRAPKSHYKK